MPIIRKINQPDKAVEEEGVLKDNDEVFYCEMSKEIFRNYEDYFDRIMLLNSTVWTCALTSRPQLTYAEALDSERDARRILRNFPAELKAPLLYIAGCTQRSGIAELVDDCISFMGTRFFREEHVSVLEQQAGRKDAWRDCEVLAVLAPDANAGDPLADVSDVDPARVRYTVRHMPDEKTKQLPQPFVAIGAHLKRHRNVLAKEKVKLFLKQCVECSKQGMYRVKADVYAKHVTDGGVRQFSDFWVGKPPTFQTSKWLQLRMQRKEMELESSAVSAKKKSAPVNGSPASGGKEPSANAKGKAKVKPSSKENKKPAAKPKDKNVSASASTAKNQPDISNYFSKNPAADKSAGAIAPPKHSKEELLRQRKAKEEAEAVAKRQQAEERERQRAELMQRVAVALKTHNRIAEDLELADQRPLPVPQPVHALIPNALLGNAFFVLEFICSFQSVLECTDKFPRGFNLALLERSLLCPEIAGPLSDTIQVLLGTIFALQIEEAADVDVEYVNLDFFEAQQSAQLGASGSPDVDRAVRSASLATGWTQTFLATPLARLPMDAHTVSELLRLHLLTSGAREEDECAKWRYQQRGGYRNVDDPGLALRVRLPHIVHALATRSVYELPSVDLLQILMCLINQIITYSTIRDLIDERIETAQRARITLRTLIAAERRRESAQLAELRTLRETYRKRAKDEPPASSAALEAQLNEKIRALNVRSDRAKAEYQQLAQKQRQLIFSYQLQLGADRAHRTYWLFESVHGLFVEWPSVPNVCLAQPPQHDAVLAQYTNDAERNKYLRQLVIDEQQLAGDRPAKSAAVKHANGGALVPETKETAIDAVDAPPLRTELLMCTGSPKSCPVHGTRAHDADHDWVYAFLHTEQQLDALIAGLNPRGMREKLLREQLETDREMILNHITACEVRRLQVQPEKRAAQLEALYALPNYANARLGFPVEMPVADVTEGVLVDGIAELERRVTQGHLGTLRVPDADVWRRALTEARDDGQSATLRWGPDAAFSHDNRIRGKSVEPAAAKPDAMETEDEPEEVSATIVYTDPGAELATNCMATAEDDTDEAAAAAAAAARERIYHIARSLLQIAQAVDPQFLRHPFGARTTKRKYQALLRAEQEAGRRALAMWQVSLMNATSCSQVFLHQALLEDSIIWSRSTLNAVCKVCRRRNNPEQMLLCDGCNAGRHMFCFKPKLTKIPPGEWFCEECKPPTERKKRAPAAKRKKFVGVESSDENEDCLSSDDGDADADKDMVYKYFEQRNDVDNGVECSVCEETGGTQLICDVCLEQCHLGCAQPPQKKPIRPWFCKACRKLSAKKQRNVRKKALAASVRSQITYLEYEAEVYESDADKETGKRKRQPPSSKAAARANNGSSDTEYNEDEDDSQDSLVEVRPAKKMRPSRRASKRKPAPVSREESSEEDDDDNDDDTENDNHLPGSDDDDSKDADFRAGGLSAARRSSRRSSGLAHAAKKRSSVSSRRQSGQVNGRPSGSKRSTSNNHNGAAGADDNDDDDEDDRPLANGRTAAAAASSRRSRRTENGSSADDDRNGGDADGQRHDTLLDAVAFYDLLKQMSKHRDAWPFERPVNRQEVPDYYLVIERPMDLSKIKSKLNLGEYRSNNEIMRDVQQIFVNCDLYNTNGSEIYRAGVALESFVRERCEALHLPFKPSDMLLSEIALLRTEAKGNRKTHARS